jgi:hypothetical protein
LLQKKFISYYYVHFDNANLASVSKERIASSRLGFALETYFQFDNQKIYLTNTHQNIHLQVPTFSYNNLESNGAPRYLVNQRAKQTRMSGFVQLETAQTRK